MKAPGANTNINAPSPGNNSRPKIAPEPSISRIAPRIPNANVKPNPIPAPSKRDESVVFLLANASARPNTMQLTTIRGMKIPKVAYRQGRRLELVGQLW